MPGFKNGQRVRLKSVTITSDRLVQPVVVDKKATVTGEFDPKTNTQPMLLDGTSSERNYGVALFEDDVLPEEAKPCSIGMLGVPNRKTG